MSACVLDIDDLSISYASGGAELMALRNVNLRVPQRSVVGIVGESGCGKSTLVSSIFRLSMDRAVVKSGRILVNETDILALSEGELNRLRGREMAMIFQDPFTALSPVLSIGRQLVDVQYREPGSLAAKRRKAIDSLEQVGIDDAERRASQYPHQFSGGMLQRICIAMALVVKPALLVADEPTTALDATTEVQILSLLRKFQESTGASILLVSHHLSVIAELCEDVVIMYAGEVVEQGQIREVFNNPLHPYTQQLMQCDPARIPGRSRRLPHIPGMVSRVMGPPGGCVFAPRCSKAMSRCSVEIPVTHNVADRRVKCHLFGSDDAAGN